MVLLSKVLYQEIVMQLKGLACLWIFGLLTFASEGHISHLHISTQFWKRGNSFSAYTGYWALPWSWDTSPKFRLLKKWKSAKQLTWLGTSCWSLCDQYHAGSLQLSWPSPPGQYNIASAFLSELTHTQSGPGRRKYTKSITQTNKLYYCCLLLSRWIMHNIIPLTV